MRPASYLKTQLFTWTGNMVPRWASCAVLVSIALVFYRDDVRLSSEWWIYPAGLLAVLITFLLKFLYSFCISLMAFWETGIPLIGHVQRPVALLRSIRAALPAGPQARVFFELQCARWMLTHRAVWDFCYEQCSYLSPAAARAAFEAAGFDVVEMEHVFDGQYLWVEVAPRPGETDPCFHPADTVQLAAQLGEHERELVRSWRQRIAQLARSGRVAVWGAATKGVLFANLIDPDRRAIACAVDVNPAKQGCCLPGSGHAIIAPQQLAAMRIDHVLVMNPSYRPEIERTLARLAVNASIVEVVSARTRTRAA